MINSVQATNYLGERVTMRLRNPEQSGFLIFNMTGLGPEKAEIRTTEIVTNDGSIYNSSRLPSRNIVIMIRYMPKNEGATAGWDTVEEAREASYKFFPIKKPIKLVIRTDNRIAEIEGYVESNEPVIFSREVHTQISIICPFPYFYAAGSTATIFSGVEPMFEFPFSNEDPVEPLIIFGEIKAKAEEVVFYDGDSEVGITMIVDAIGPVDQLRLYNVQTRESMFIDTDRLEAMTGAGFGAGDRIIINTTKGSKSIFLLRGGIYTNILNTLNRDADWFQLSKGDNIFAFDADEGAANLLFRIEHRVIYEGV